jgi:DNA-binding IclR family transcriptional regulator
MSSESSNAARSQSAERALETLFVFNSQRPDLTVDEIARSVGMPLATAYRYVALMRELNIVAEGPGGTYHLTPRVLALAEAVEHSKGLLAQARPVLHQLMRMSNETALLVQLVGHSAICADRAEPAHTMRLTYQPGQTVSLEQGASARILIAGLTPEERDAHLSWLEKQRPGFSERRAEFELEIERNRQDGWAISYGEIDEGIIAVAAPVKVRGRTLGALSIAGPSFRVTPAGLDERRTAVVKAAGDLSAGLEGTLSPA